MSVVKASEWHRTEAVESRIASAEAQPVLEKRYWERAAAHHATAADALEALAVVADLLADLSRARRVETWEPPTPDATSPGTGGDLTDDERAALATLAKIASEGK